MQTKTRNSKIGLTAKGRVMITDAETGEVIMEKKNAVHSQNMARAIAHALAHEAQGAITTLAFGNGGTFFNSSSVINYRSPNVVGSGATLYNQTYAVQVDEQAVATPATNSVVAINSPAPAVTSTVIITAYLSASEPAGQAVSDNVTVDPEASYVFDELGLKDGSGALLTHCIFAPVEKTANRSFLITYTLTVSVS